VESFGRSFWSQSWEFPCVSWKISLEAPGIIYLVKALDVLRGSPGKCLATVPGWRTLRFYTGVPWWDNRKVYSFYDTLGFYPLRSRGAEHGGTLAVTLGSILDLPWGTVGSSLCGYPRIVL
jgi:hypothetical protein